MVTVLMLTGMVLSFNSGASCQDIVAQTYTGFYTGKIVPGPKEAEYHDDAWELVDCKAGTTSACILISPEASEAEKIAAQEIAARIAHLSDGVSVPIRLESERPEDGKLFIAIGLPATSALVKKDLARSEATVPDKPEGYLIACRQQEVGVRSVLLAGHDPAGAFFAAQSLVQMMERVEDKVVLHPVTVTDWPSFKLRSFKVGGAFGPDSTSMRMGLWAPFAKLNCYNICYTTLGAEKWVAPEAGYREHVETLTKFTRARGLDVMPFVNPYYLWKEHIETSDEGDLVKLFEACKIALDAGGKRVMLCLDDFASKQDRKGPKLYHVRSEKDQARWGDDLGAVNVAMINDLNGRLKEAHPDCQLYVVLPYYWNPSGSYREGGEQDLRTIGEGADEDVRIVWTGPRVRSGVITERDIEHYQGLLGGRKVMLWDNTIYMHHRPPHYFLDSFHTEYPDRFWELISGEVHLNAGGGEAYKCGLLAAADYLWNPEAYDPEESIRNTIAMVAGPDQVDDLLSFRDAFYTLYDQYAAQLGKPGELLAQVKKMERCPFDEAGIEEFTSFLDEEQSLADKIAANCKNEGLVEEVQKRLEMHAQYREAFDILAKLPPMTEEDAANVAPNPDAEETAGGRPAQWATYTGAGRRRLSVVEGRDGGHCAKLTATELYDWHDGRKSINVAVMIGETNGFSGEKAPEALPLHRYYFSFWLKGNAPRVVVSFTTWDAKGERGSRGFAGVKMEPFAANEEWTFYSGAFITPANAERGALKIGIEGFLSQGGGLGEICVDDVYVGRSKTKAMEGAPEE